MRFDGDPLLGHNVETIARMGVSHVPEGRGVIEELTVEENLRLATLWCLRKHQRSGGHCRRPSTSSRACVTSASGTPPRFRGASDRCSFSAGPSSRGPRLLLLDEPSLGLAPLVTAQLMALIRDQTEGTDLTVVLVEQNARSALSVSHHAVILNLGQVVVSNDADTVAADDALRHHYLGF